MTKSAFGDWFRELRLRRGLRGGALSRRANLSRSYISSMEAGRALPKVESLTRLADAMGLDAGEREELFRRAFKNADPEPFAKSMQGELLLGATAWRDLPTLLFNVQHKLIPELPICIDQAMFDVVRAGAALLGWVAMVKFGIGPDAQDQLRAIWKSAQKWRGKGHEDFDVFRVAALSLLATAWRAMLLRNRPAVESLTQRMEGWWYSIYDRGVSIVFFGSRDQRDFGVGNAASDDLYLVYDLLTGHRIAETLGLDVTLLADNPAVGDYRIASLLGQAPALHAIDLKEAAAKLSGAERGAAADYLTVAHRGHLASRVADVPHLYRWITGNPPPLAGRLLRHKAGELELLVARHWWNTSGGEK